MMAPSIAACRNIKESDARVECLQGTFNVIGVWMWNNQFGLTFPKSDSLALCRSFEDSEVSNACYYELSMNLLPFANGDLVKVYNLYAASIEDDEIAGMVMNSAAAGVLGVNIAQDDFISFLKDCRALPQRVEVDCLKG
jgi:hypothetical protein